MVIIGAAILGIALMIFGRNGSDSIFTTMVGGADGHAIEYNLNGGTGDFNRVVVDYEDNEYMIPHKEPSRESYIFNGWKDSIDNNVHYPGSTLIVEEDIELTAVWNASTHDVTYNLNGGVANISNEKVPFDEVFTLTDIEPTKEGQHLVGWESSVDGIVYDSGAIVDIKGATTFTAVWNLNTYTVSHDLAGGTATTPYDTINVVHNKYYNIPANEPTRTGYVFHGWENSVSGESIDAGGHFKVTDNTVLKARWSSDSYRLRYMLNGGAYTEDQPELTYFSEYGETHRTLSNIPKRSGYKFIGWKNSRSDDIHSPGSAFDVQGDTELVAEWELIDFKVTFKLEGGTGSYPVQSIGHNETLTLPSENPTRYGYVFNGWLNNKDHKTYNANESFVVQADTTLTAQWLNDRFDIDYDLNGGKGSFSPTTGLYGNEFTLPNHEPSMEGASFTGWLNSQDSKIYKKGEKFEVSDRTTLTAQWSVNDYTVSYDLDGGSGTFLASGVRHGGQHTVLGGTPRKEGHRFEGWKINGRGDTYSSGSKVTITSDVKFVAQWTPEDYSITYNLSGGQGSHKTETSKYNHNYDISPEIPTRLGYRFDGWVAGSSKYQPNDRVVIYRDLNLTAQWKYESYEVTYNLAGGQTTDALSALYEVDYGHTHKILDETPRRIGYHFTGWKNSSDGKIYKIGESIRITEPTELEAQWSIGEFTVKFDLNGGSVNNQSAFNEIKGKHNHQFNIDSQVPKLPGNNQLEFAGWKDTASSGGFVYGAGESYIIAEDTTLVAQWGYGTYKVIYDETVYGQITYPDPVAVEQYDVNTKDGHLVIYGPTSTRDSHEFDGWVSNVTGTKYFEGDRLIPTKDTTLTAQWKLKQYTLKYNMVGGVGTIPDVTIEHGVGMDISSTVPTKQGYIFKGWVTYPVKTSHDVVRQSDIYRSPDKISATADTTLYAVWEPQNIEVRYLLGNNITNGGNFTTTYVEYDSDFILPNVKPTATGYTFMGWRTPRPNYMYGVGGRFKVDASVVNFQNSSVDISAVWEANQYTVSYDAGLGSGAPASVKVLYGDSYKLSSTKPTRTGYTFTGWKGSDGGTYEPGGTITVKSDITLTAQWRINSYNISFDQNGAKNSGFGTISRKHNEGYEIPAGPLRSGYTFTGWKQGNVWRYPGERITITSSVHLVAQWSQNKYTVTYNLAGGNHSNIKNVTGLTHGAIHTPTKLIPIRSGWVFDGWLRSSTGKKQTNSFSMSQDETLTAQWVKTYNVTYDLNGGTGGPSNGSGRTGYTFTVPPATPTRTGYTFDGWKHSTNGSTYQPGGKFNLSSDVTLTADWRPNTLTVSYDANGGHSAPANQTKEYGATLKLSYKKPRRSGHTFQGWNTKSDGTGTNYSPSANYTANSDVTLYAMWKPNSHTITYDLNGGSGSIPSRTQDYGTLHTASRTKPTRTGYTFVDWTRSDGGGIRMDPGTTFMVTGDITITANWKRNTPATISFDLNGGELSIINRDKFDPVTVMTGERYSPPYAQPTRKDHHFDGWQRPNGSVIGQYGGFDVTGSETLTAKWTRYTYVYALIARDGEPTESIRMSMDSPTHGRITVRTPLGYVWRDRATGKIYEDGDTFQSNKTVTFDEIKR